MNRLDTFKNAMAGMTRLQARYPNDPAVDSIVTQLDYLIDLEVGNRNDREGLNDIIIGVLAVREIEPLDQNIAETLYKVVEEVEKMKNEGKSQSNRLRS